MPAIVAVTVKVTEALVASGMAGENVNVLEAEGGVVSPWPCCPFALSANADNSFGFPIAIVTELIVSSAPVLLVIENVVLT